MALVVAPALHADVWWARGVCRHAHNSLALSVMNEVRLDELGMSSILALLKERTTSLFKGEPRPSCDPRRRAVVASSLRVALRCVGCAQALLSLVSGGTV